MTEAHAVGHTVLLWWTPDAPSDQGLKVAAALNSMARDLKGALFYQAGPDMGIKSGTADFGVFAVFASREHYVQYAENPRHVTIIEELIAPYRAARTTAQIQIEAWSGAAHSEQDG